jgi:hypothetical protein
MRLCALFISISRNWHDLPELAWTNANGLRAEEVVPARHGNQMVEIAGDALGCEAGL